MVSKKDNPNMLNFYDEKFDILTKEYLYKIVKLEILIYALISTRYAQQRDECVEVSFT